MNPSLKFVLSSSSFRSNMFIKCLALWSKLLTKLIKFKTPTNFSALKEQHESEMSQLESLVMTSQELLGKQSRKFIKELDKLVMTDITIKHLIDQNDDLTQTVNQMKQKFNISTKSAFKGIEEEISKEERRWGSWILRVKC